MLIIYVDIPEGIQITCMYAWQDNEGTVHLPGATLRDMPTRSKLLYSHSFSGHKQVNENDRNILAVVELLKPYFANSCALPHIIARQYTQ